MPEIAFFFGIAITVFFRDHGPAHIHASHGRRKGRFAHSDWVARIVIRDGSILDGEIPTRDLKLVPPMAAIASSRSPRSMADCRTRRDASKSRTVEDPMSPRRHRRRPFPTLLLVEWIEKNCVRLFFASGKVSEVALPIQLAKKAHIVHGGVGLDIGDGREMSAATLHELPGLAWTMRMSR